VTLPARVKTNFAGGPSINICRLHSSHSHANNRELCPVVDQPPKQDSNFHRPRDQWSAQPSVPFGVWVARPLGDVQAPGVGESVGPAVLVLGEAGIQREAVPVLRTSDDGCHIKNHGTMLALRHRVCVVKSREMKVLSRQTDSEVLEKCG